MKNLIKLLAIVAVSTFTTTAVDAQVRAPSRDAINRVSTKISRADKLAAMDTTDLWEMQTTKRHNNNVVKMGPLSFLNNQLTLGYEYRFDYRKSLDVGVHIIGVGQSWTDDETSGLAVTAGVKFYAMPDVIARGSRFSHPLQGYFLKPEIGISSYQKEQSGFWGIEKAVISNTQASLMLHLGRQFVFGNLFTVECTAGAGFSGSLRNNYENSATDGSFDNMGYQYTHFNVRNTALSLRVRVGLLH
ncbi:MAG: hypothetical protein RL757_3182 [Bacteroidota bacterium]|jgi:hypothetical protein